MGFLKRGHAERVLADGRHAAPRWLKYLGVERILQPPSARPRRQKGSMDHRRPSRRRRPVRQTEVFRQRLDRAGKGIGLGASPLGTQDRHDAKGPLYGDHGRRV